MFDSSEVSYRLILNVSGQDSCNGIEQPREAIEFSIRSGGEGRWIPLMLSYNEDGVASNSSTEIVRGYEVPIQFGQDTTFGVIICGDALLTNEVQFRWMGTADVETDRLFISDMWALAQVDAYLVTLNGLFILLQDHFGGKILK